MYKFTYPYHEEQCTIYDSWRVLVSIIQGRNFFNGDPTQKYEWANKKYNE